MDPLTLLQQKYPFTSVVLYTDTGMLEYQFIKSEECATIKKYNELLNLIKNLKTSHLSFPTDKLCNFVIKINLYDYTATFYFYRDEKNILQLKYSIFADSIFTKAITDLVESA